VAVHVAPAGETDGLQAKHLIDIQPPQRRRQRILGDTAYGNGPVGAELAERAVDVLAPIPEASMPEGRLGKRDFRIDPATGTVSCPAGNIAPISPAASGVRRAAFARPACRECRRKSRCCPTLPRKVIELNADEELLIAARTALEDPASAEHLRRTRPRIERLLGLLAHRYGARKSRYIGSAKARLQAAWAAALVNLNPIAHRLALHNA
jgi:Transposase DDE domain